MSSPLSDVPDGGQRLNGCPWRHGDALSWPPPSAACQKCWRRAVSVFILVISLTYSCRCRDGKAVTHTHFSRAQLMHWDCQSPKAFNVPTECRAPLLQHKSFIKHQSIINYQLLALMGRWGGWWRGLGSELALIVQGARLKWCTTSQHSTEVLLISLPHPGGGSEMTSSISPVSPTVFLHLLLGSLVIISL